MTNSNTFPALLQTFFTDRLLRQRRASPNTVASYRDSFRLLLRFAKETLEKEPSILSFDDLTPDFLCSYLDYIEQDRGNSTRTRNTNNTSTRAPGARTPDSDLRNRTSPIPRPGLRRNDRQPDRRNGRHRPRDLLQPLPE